MRFRRRLVTFLFLTSTLWIVILITLLYSVPVRKGSSPRVGVMDREPENRIIQRLLKGGDVNETYERVSGSNSTRMTSQTSGPGHERAQELRDVSTRLAWPPMAGPGDPGYGGKGVTINLDQMSAAQRQVYERDLTTYQVNKMAADLVPLRRRLNFTMDECSHLTYDLPSLPRAGVVIIFNNELWSVLMRTVFSILDAGPSELISEIVLVDDASDQQHLQQPLDDYLVIFEGKVKLVRMSNRSGLIKARLAGFDHVTGDVAVFLDAHCEVNAGQWGVDDNKRSLKPENKTGCAWVQNGKNKVLGIFKQRRLPGIK
ncbi:polypeptide N-acetylgalactosaminyltransferase 5 [Aplysia californica]|uniref:Polypeptide N-acetylgalactosaminyltransferase 5 n=1 Tax=Aplysia californica TaxID=6500 RepID=A0ABM1AB45_APLCA|nr:polypeptide N-acetylgalactosaminyltransferase 5 [Aplysia californica]